MRLCGGIFLSNSSAGRGAGAPHAGLGASERLAAKRLERRLSRGQAVESPETPLDDQCQLGVGMSRECFPQHRPLSPNATGEVVGGFAAAIERDAYRADQPAEPAPLSVTR